MIHIHQLWLQYLAAAEGKQLPGEDAGTIGGTEDLFHFLPPWIRRLGSVQEHMAVSANNRQKIVEVMSNASRQPANGLHLLCLAELFFQLPAGCDILRNARHPVWPVFRIIHRKTAVVDPSHRTIRTDDAIEFLDRFRSLLLGERKEVLPVLRVHSFHQPVTVSKQSCGTAPPHFLEGRADIKDLFSVQIEHPKDLIDVLCQLPEPLFAL